MRKMKKVLSLAMTAAMTASLLTGMGAVTASAKKSDEILLDCYKRII